MKSQAIAPPKFVIDCLAALRAERAPLAARLEAIDIAMRNLSAIWGDWTNTTAHKAKPERQTRERRPYTKRKPPAVVAPPAKEPPVTSTEAAARRDSLLGAIMKSEVGLTIADLRKAFPKIGEKDRCNALQQLKLRGVIRRAGNAWIKVESAA